MRTFLIALLLLVSCRAFAPVSVPAAAHRRTELHAVIDIGSEAAFDKTLKDSGNALVVVDYSTTWCGPCKGRFVVGGVVRAA